MGLNLNLGVLRLVLYSYLTRLNTPGTDGQ